MKDACSACGESFLYEVEGKLYSREESVQIPGVYDGTLLWQCPFCGHRRHRWAYPHRLHALAARYVSAGKGA